MHCKRLLYSKILLFVIIRCENSAQAETRESIPNGIQLMQPEMKCYYAEFQHGFYSLQKESCHYPSRHPVYSPAFCCVHLRLKKHNIAGLFYTFTQTNSLAFLCIYFLNKSVFFFLRNQANIQLMWENILDLNNHSQKIFNPLPGLR